MVSSELKKYRVLIQNMPVQELACFSKRSTWLEFTNKCRSLLQTLNRFNVNDELVVISRQDLFRLAREEGISAQFIYATIIWGYPGGVRGGYFSQIISNTNAIIRNLQELPENIAETNWLASYKTLNEIPGLGISSWTKLLYFLRFRVGGSSALILDGRLIKFFGMQVFPDFDAISTIAYRNSPQRYLLYLQLMSGLAKELGVDADKLEMFLFTFGTILKIPTAAGQ